MARTERIPTREELVCLVCRKPGVALHHVSPRSVAPQSKDDPWNIAPICPVCHDLVHQKRIEMRVRRGYFEWRQKGAKFWVSIPVKVNERHGCIDFGAGGRAEAQADDESSAPSEAGSAAAEAEDASLSISAAEEASSSRAERLADNQEYVGSNPTWPHNSAAASPASGGKVAKGQSKRVTASKSLVCGTGSHNRGASDAGYKAGEEREGPLSTGAGENSTAEAGEEVAVSATEVSRASTSAVPPSSDTLLLAGHDAATDRPKAVQAGGGMGVAALPTRQERSGRKSGGGPRNGASPRFDLETWREQGQKLAQMGQVLRESTWAWQFLVGDWFLEGEAVLGNEVYGHLDDIGFAGATLQQYVWVAEEVPPHTRVRELSWTHHRHVAALPPGKQTEWLQAAREKNMTSRELHQAIHGKQPRVKRWSFEELESHLCHTCREVVSLMEKR